MSKFFNIDDLCNRSPLVAILGDFLSNPENLNNLNLRLNLKLLIEMGEFNNYIFRYGPIEFELVNLF